MKRLLLVFIVAALACSSAFSADLSLGVMQSYYSTSVELDAESDRFGFEGAVGAALIPGIVQAVKYGGNGWKDQNGNDVSVAKALDFLTQPTLMLNAYWKVIDGKAFGMRLGLQTDAVAMFSSDEVALAGVWGTSIGLNFKFNDRFALNITGTVPAVYLLQIIGDEVARYGMYYATTKAGSASGMLSIVAAVNELARVSVKWSI